MENIILKTKLSNRLKTKAPFNVDTFLFKNIIVNKQRRGCSGYILNRDNRACVYVNTEPSCNPKCSLLYHYADYDKNDFKNGKNRYAKDFDDLVSKIIKMLLIPITERPYEGDATNYD